MTPPINIDGSTVNAITIDGTDVSEVTVDGEVVFGNAIPDPDIARWAAENDNGDTSVLFDSVGSFDGTAVDSPSYDPSGGNDGNGAYSLNGAGDGFSLPSGLFPQDADFSVGFRVRSSESGGQHLLTLKADLDSEMRFDSGPSIAWESFDGADFTGPSVPYPTGSYISGVATYNSDTPEMTLYVEDASDSVQQAINTKSGQGGWGYRPSDGTLYAAMDFADGAVWGRTLSESEAQAWINDG